MHDKPAGFSEHKPFILDSTRPILLPYPSTVTTTSIPLPRYEAWPVRTQRWYDEERGRSNAVIPALVRKVWFDDKGRRCTAFPVECHGNTEDEAGETAAVCAVALAAHFGGIADTSRIKTK